MCIYWFESVHCPFKVAGSRNPPLQNEPDPKIPFLAPLDHLAVFVYLRVGFTKSLPCEGPAEPTSPPPLYNDEENGFKLYTFCYNAPIIFIKQ